MQELSLLDWLKLKWEQPRSQRLFRFMLAGLLVLWAGRLLLAETSSGLIPFAILLGAAALFMWALAARGPGRPIPEGLEIQLSPGLSAAPAAAQPAEGGGALPWLKLLRLPAALAPALLAQASLHSRPAEVGGPLLLYVLGVGLFAFSVWRDGLLGTPRAALAAESQALPVRGRWLALAALAGAYAFLAAGGNRFRVDGVFAWVVSIAAWVVAMWDWRVAPAELWARARTALSGVLRADDLTLRLTSGMLLFALVLAVGAYFRLAQLIAIPPEMTSDHVEKLFDVNDVLNGLRPIFFERNTGREPLQFYFAAFVAQWLGTGLTHLTLKITGVVAGLLMLPFIYLLGRELEDRAFGLLAMGLAGISFWAVAISRVGLRFPLTPLFVAPVLFFLVRGLRRSSRNDFLLAGLFLGAGLYGYSTFRVVPLLVLAAAVWFLLWPQARGARMRLLAHMILLFTTALVVFVPLYRYAAEPDSHFWYRSLSRLSESESAIEGHPVAIFLQNQLNGLAMFNWRGDEVWVNTIPNLPVLDVVTGVLFVLGLVYLLGRLVLRRDWLAGLLLLALPILLLPSTLSLAFPNENPSVVRAGGAIPVVMLIAAYPARLLLRQLRATLGAVWPAARARQGSLLAVGLLLALAAALNHQWYFVRYPANYLAAAQNASEIGAVVGAYARSFGSFERAYICLHPHWADTRAVGLYAGQAGWEQVLPAAEFARLAQDSQPLLVIVNPRSEECLSALAESFPDGRISQVHSERGPDKDFLVFYAPGQ